MANQRRVHRVAEKVRETVALELQQAADPRFIMVTISSVVVSPDLRNVKIYWVVSGGPERRAEVQDAFESAHGLFRRVVGRDLGIKFVPELRFYYDDTLDTSEEVMRLLQRVQPSPIEDSETVDTAEDSKD